ncbi:MAG: hypothetical protein ABIF04_03400 [Chloroflexota bacterium]
MTLQGKGFITLALPDCEGGGPEAIVTEARAAGLSHVIVKIADGVQAFGVDASGNDSTAPVVQALRSAGITVWGWHYLYGDTPSDEANIAVQRAQSLGLDGYVVSAGSDYKQSGKEIAAGQFMSAVREALTIPIALSSFRFPNYHPEFPWSPFLEKCDFHMPQVYWELAHNAGEQLRESKHQCDALPNAKPYIATGPTYSVIGWEPRPIEISEFLSTACDLGISAVNFFDWDSCRKSLPEIWTTIAEFGWPTSPQTSLSADSPMPEPTHPPEPEPLNLTTPEPAAPPPTASTPTPSPSSADVFSTQFLAALNSRKAGQVAALYGTNATRVWDGNLVYGSISIQAAYEIFFSGLPAGTTFTLSKVKGDEDLLLINWKAGSSIGKTTLFFQEGKIILDYTYLG